MYNYSIYCIQEYIST